MDKNGLNNSLNKNSNVNKKKLKDLLELEESKEIKAVKEYKKMLIKSLSRNFMLNLKYKIKKSKTYLIIFSLSYISYKMLKFSVILYYYIMWDIDIRKPKVSDYIIERFR